MRLRVICAVFVLGAMAAACDTQRVQTDLRPLKIREVTVTSEGVPQSEVEFLQTAITGELFRRGAVMDQNGLTVHANATWMNLADGSATGLKVTASAVDTQGLSFSVATSVAPAPLSSFEMRTEVLAKNVAVRFTDNLAEQIKGQMNKGRTQETRASGSAPATATPAATGPATVSSSTAVPTPKEK